LITQEALQLLIDTSQQAAGGQILGLLDVRRQVVAINGKTEIFVVPPPPRGHVLHSMEDVLRFAEASLEVEAGVITRAPVIWHGESDVVVICDDADRWDRATFPLQRSRQYLALLACELAADTQRRALSQTELIRLLRFDLGVEPATVARFRRLNWQTSGDAVSHQEHVDQQLSKSVVAKVQAVDELPDVLRIVCPVYDHPGLNGPQGIACGLEIDASRQEFYCQPLPGELAAAQQRVQAALHDWLVEELAAAACEIPVYYGVP